MEFYHGNRKVTRQYSKEPVAAQQRERPALLIAALFIYLSHEVSLGFHHHSNETGKCSDIVKTEMPFAGRETQQRETHLRQACFFTYMWNIKGKTRKYRGSVCRKKCE